MEKNSKISREKDLIEVHFEISRFMNVNWAEYVFFVYVSFNLTQQRYYEDEKFHFKWFSIYKAIN